MLPINSHIENASNIGSRTNFWAFIIFLFVFKDGKFKPPLDHNGKKITLDVLGLMWDVKQEVNSMFIQSDKIFLSSSRRLILKSLDTIKLNSTRHAGACVFVIM